MRTGREVNIMASEDWRKSNSQLLLDQLRMKSEGLERQQVELTQLGLAAHEVIRKSPTPIYFDIQLEEHRIFTFTQSKEIAEAIALKLETTLREVERIGYIDYWFVVNHQIVVLRVKR